MVKWMDFPFSSAVVSTHAHATESEERVLQAFRALLPEAAAHSRSSMEGHHGNPITCFEARIEQRALLRETWERVKARLRAGELDRIRAALAEKVDDSCRLYLRFDKQLAYGGELALTDGGDAVHLKLKVAAFPAKKETALALVERFIGAA